MRRGLGVVLLSGVGGNSILMKGRTAACLGERASDIRVAGRTGRSCAPTVVHITWLVSCDAFLEFMYRL